MRPLVSFILLSLLLSGAAVARAESPFVSCTGNGSGNSPAQSDVDAFAVALKSQFDATFKLSHEELMKNIRCLRGESGEDCTTRMEYFRKTLPLQWKKYRENLALSSWDSSFRYALDSGVMFNHDLQIPHSLEMGGGTPEPLTAAEIAEHSARFNEESARIFTAVAAEADTTAKKVRDAGMRDEYIHRAGAEVLRRGDWREILLSQNSWGYAAESKLNQVVFKLSKMRMIQQLVSHPLLAYLERAELNDAEIIRALGKLRDNLSAEQMTISRTFAGALNHGHYFELRLASLLDYLPVVDGLLGNAPQYCGIAQSLYARMQSRQMLFTLITTGATVGIMLMVPPAWGLAGGIALQGYYIYASQNERRANIQASFTTENPALSLKHADDAYLAAEDQLTEVYMTPFALVGLPVFRLTRVLKLIR